MVLAILLGAAALAAELPPPDVNSAGDVLLDTAVVYDTALVDEGEIALASDDTSSLAVWHDTRWWSTDGTRYRVLATRVSEPGRVLDPWGIELIDTWAYPQGTPAVSFDETSCFVVWGQSRRGDLRDIYGARVSRTGEVLDKPFPVLSAPGAQDWVAIATDGAGYLVAWQDARSDSVDICAARVTSTGVVVDPDGFVVSAAPGVQGSPEAAFSGSQFLVVWQDNRNGNGNDVYAARVRPDGVLLDSSGLFIAGGTGDQGGPVVAAADSGWLVAWEDREGTARQRICWCRVLPSGAVTDSNALVVPPPSVIGIGGPALASAPDGFRLAWKRGVAWWDDSLFTARLLPSGARRDSTETLVTTGRMGRPTLVRRADGHLIAWCEHARAFAARLDPEGALVDTVSILLSTRSNRHLLPSIATGTMTSCAVWQDERYGNTCEVRGIRLSRSGHLLGEAPMTLSDSGQWNCAPTIAAVPGRYLVVWARLLSNEYLNAEDTVLMRRIDERGALLDSQPTVLAPGRDPVVTSYGNEYFVTWASEGRIRGTRIDRLGTVLNSPGIGISDLSASICQPSAAGNSRGYLVAWVEGRLGQCEIQGRRVSLAGVVQGSQDILISRAFSFRHAPCVASDGTSYLVAWEDRRAGESYDIYAARVTADGVVLDTAGIVIAARPGEERNPCVIFDGFAYLVLWEDQTLGSKNPVLRGARVSRAGEVFDTVALSSRPGAKCNPAATFVEGDRALLCYAGHTDLAGSSPCNTYRIWCTELTRTGVAEDPPGPPGSIRLTVSPSIGRTFTARAAPVPCVPLSLSVCDALGRVVQSFRLKSRTGAVPVSSLAPGVYFVLFGSGPYRATFKIVKTD